MELLLVFVFLITALSIGAPESEVDQAGDEMRQAARIEKATSKDVPDARPTPCRYFDGSPIQRDLTVPQTPIQPRDRDTKIPRVFCDE